MRAIACRAKETCILNKESVAPAHLLPVKWRATLTIPVRSSFSIRMQRAVAIIVIDPIYCQDLEVIESVSASKRTCRSTLWRGRRTR